MEEVKCRNVNKLNGFKRKYHWVSMGPCKELRNMSITLRLGIRKKKHDTKYIERDNFMKALFKNRP